MADSMIATTGKAERVRELMRTVGMLPVLVLLLVGFAPVSYTHLTLPTSDLV